MKSDTSGDEGEARNRKEARRTAGRRYLLQSLSLFLLQFFLVSLLVLASNRVLLN